MSSLSHRIQSLRDSLPSSVKLIAVSKTFPSEKIRVAYAAGIRDFGESRVQEALPKQAELSDLSDICWHFIGHLQGNKARKVLEYFPWIHSVHSLELAQRLNQLAIALPQRPQICLQVKLLADPQKQGWSPENIKQDLEALARLKHLDIQGLMTILPLGLDPDRRLAAFQSLQTLKESLNQDSSLQFRELSMGMSNDYPQAIAAGATMIRVGSLIFGERNLR